MSSCAAIIGRQRTQITTSSPSPSPPLFYHCLLLLLLSLHYLVCLWRHSCQSWPDTATGLKRSITWVNNSTNGYGYKLPRDWNRSDLGHTPPWWDSRDIVHCSAGMSHSWASHCCLPEQYCFFIEMQHNPGAVIVPEPAFHQCLMKTWTSGGFGITANTTPVVSSTTISPDKRTHTQINTIFPPCSEAMQIRMKKPLKGPWTVRCHRMDAILGVQLAN